MNSKLIEGIANAVLYEGYMLYPYRPSAVKNRQRWNFGVLYPRNYCEIQKGADSWFMTTQCVVQGPVSAVVDVKARFLQAVSRQIGKPSAPVRAGNSDPQIEIIESLEVGGKTLYSWQEAVERDVSLLSLRIEDLLAAPVSRVFAFAAARELESVKDDCGRVAAFIVRRRESIRGSVKLRAEKCGADLFKLTVVVSNLASLTDPQVLPREEVLLWSLLSAHSILGVAGGEFISLTDPPAALQQVVADCNNVGTWPVLVGEDATKDAMLSSPIILYDYPQIAPESPGDLFDGTEIDEILALRILTLSDDEKREIRQTDERAREVLERTETMPVEHFLKLHGVLRGMKPVADLGVEPAGEDTR
ncbi:MAG: hypothetical protein WA192_08065 [Candidatus Acidiferrales bacterium]